MTARTVPTKDELFIPLSVAAAIVYRAFLRPGEPPASTDEELERRVEEAARVVATGMAVYRLDLGAPAEIRSALLAAGTFVNGGRSLAFRDGRPAIESLAVRRADLDHALARRAHIVPENRPEAIVPSRFSRPKLPR